MKQNKLPEIIKLRGIGKPVFAKLIERTNKKAIYERDDQVYEVFRIKTQKEGYAFGVKFKAGEVYPNNEDFGKIAWCYTDKNLALKKYLSL